MLGIEPASAVVVRVALPPALDRLRARRDLAASRGVPAHVTVLFPFRMPTALDPPTRGHLAEIAAAFEPFEVRFERVGRFPTVVYLAPDPSEPFSALTQALAARFPDHPPYEGAFDVVIPHLTITEAADTALDAIAEEAAQHLPFARTVSALEVLVETRDGRWHRYWRLPLGGTARRQTVRP